MRIIDSTLEGHQPDSDEAQHLHGALLRAILNLEDPRDAHQIIEERETSDILRDAIGGLTPRHQQILALRYQEELTFAEIAMELHLTVSSVHAMHRLALQRLRDSLELMGIRQITDLAA